MTVTVFEYQIFYVFISIDFLRLYFSVFSLVLVSIEGDMPNTQDSI